jgi:hypothetical protein
MCLHGMVLSKFSPEITVAYEADNFNIYHFLGYYKLGKSEREMCFLFK